VGFFRADFRKKELPLNERISSFVREACNNGTDDSVEGIKLLMQKQLELVKS